jgi:hypothetical protein
MIQIIKKIFVLILLVQSYLLAQVTVTLPTISGQPNTSITVPVTVSQLPASNAANAVTSYDFQLNYNKNSIYITAVSTSGSITSGSMTVGPRVSPQDASIDTSKGFIRGAWASATPITGSGTLFNITIKFRESGASVLEFSSTSPFTFNGGNPAANVVNGLATVSTANQSPIFDNIQKKTIKEGKELNFTVNALDPEGAAITYSASNLPTGANFTPATKTFNWKPGFTQSANYFVDFFANDGNSTGKLTVNIEVLDSNSVPVMAAIPNKTVAEGALLTFKIEATDDDGDLLLYSSSVLPPNASFNTTTQMFSWTPSFNQAGSYAIVFFVTDGVNTAQRTVLISVTESNQRPVFQTVIGNVTINVDVPAVEYTFQYTGLDPEGSSLIFSLLDGPAESVITMGGLFKWTPKPTDAEKTFRIIVSLSDGQLNSADTSFIKTGKVVSVGTSSNLPNKFELYPNYPNPFNPSTKIKFDLPEGSDVQIVLFDVLGKEKAVIAEGFKSAGTYELDFTAKNLNSGIYFLQMKAKSFIKTTKMILLQ